MNIITSLFLILIVTVWLRFFVIFSLVLYDALQKNKKITNTKDQPSLDEVTILIPAYQEENTIEKTLRSAENLIAHGAKLILVDDGSSDKTLEKLSAFLQKNKNTHLIRHETNQGKALALNSGLQAVKTSLVLTLDADTSVEISAVQAAVESLLNTSQPEQAAVVAFDVRVARSEQLFRELQALEYDASLNFERRGQSMLSAISVAPGAASLWKTAALKQIGGFSKITVTEDVDATLKLAAIGQRTLHCLKAEAFTGTPMTFSQLMAQRRRWCLGHYQNIPHHVKSLGKDLTFTSLTYPNFFLLSAFMPFMLLLSLITLFADSGTWKNTLGFLTIFWLFTIYLQRWIALRIINRKTNLIAFLTEPFSTLFFHFCAMTITLFALVKIGLGIKQDIWSSRAR